MQGAREHNLQGIDAAFPVGLLTVVTGVSGSGKSTACQRHPRSRRRFSSSTAVRPSPVVTTASTGLGTRPSACARRSGPHRAQPPAPTPATYTKLFDDLRQLYAKCPPCRKCAATRPRVSAFNMRGGRCENCHGDGQIKLDMQFLGDVYTECPACQGRRYNRENPRSALQGPEHRRRTSASRWTRRAKSFVRSQRSSPASTPLHDVGLGYHPSGAGCQNTLSGGEGAAHQASSRTEQTLPRSDPLTFSTRAHHRPALGGRTSNTSSISFSASAIKGIPLSSSNNHPERHPPRRLAPRPRPSGGGRDGGATSSTVAPPENIPVTHPTGGALHS